MTPTMELDVELIGDREVAVREVNDERPALDAVEPGRDTSAEVLRGIGGRLEERRAAAAPARFDPRIELSAAPGDVVLHFGEATILMRPLRVIAGRGPSRVGNPAGTQKLPVRSRRVDRIGNPLMAGSRPASRGMGVVTRGFPRVVPVPEWEPTSAEAAFARHVLPEIDVLYRVALSLTHNAADAEDVVQETLMRAYRSIERFDGRHARAWLLTILRNANINRSRRRRPGLFADPEEGRRALEAGDPEPSSGGGGHRRPLRRRRRRRARRAPRAVPADRRPRRPRRAQLPGDSRCAGDADRDGHEPPPPSPPAYAGPVGRRGPGAEDAPMSWWRRTPHRDRRSAVVCRGGRAAAAVPRRRERRGDRRPRRGPTSTTASGVGWMPTSTGTSPPRWPAGGGCPMSRCAGCASSGTASRPATSPTNERRPRLRTSSSRGPTPARWCRRSPPRCSSRSRSIAVRRNRDLLWFVAGRARLTFAWFALRTVH